MLLVCSVHSVQAGTLVTISTNFGDIKVDLFSEVTPQTVDNFVNLITAGRYTNTIFHRVDDDFMIQGGGFDLNFNAIPNNGPIPLDYKVRNTRGTIAMARQPAPNTATSQFFINTVDNSAGLGPGGWSADGYTVFGWVVQGMNVVDAIEAVPIYQFAAPFGELPLRNYTMGNPIQDANKVIVNSISITAQHASYQNPILTADTNSDGNVNPADALLIINSINNHGTHNASSAFINFTPGEGEVYEQYKYFDPTGDNRVNTSDLLFVINAILAKNAAASLAAEPMAAPLAAVPEPATWGMMLSALAALGAIGWRRYRRSN